MNTLINATSLREYFEITPDVVDTRLTPSTAAASRRLRAWVGDDVYADALSDDPADADRQADLKMAEAWLAMYFALVGMNTNVTPAGAIKATKVEGNRMIEYLTPKEMRDLSQLYFDQAHEIAQRYMLTDETPEAEFAVIDE